MKTNVTLISIVLVLMMMSLPQNMVAQYQITIDASTVTHQISPFIYGMSYKTYPYATARALNGSRMTSFNWETNVSNIGAFGETPQDNNTNDYFIPGIVGVDSLEWSTPGITLKTFQQSCDDEGLFSAIVVPMAGYVASNSTSIPSDIAPSGSWVELANNSNQSPGSSPKLNDGFVYNNEFIQYLKSTSGENGVDAFFLDNEPGLWYQEYPHIVGLPLPTQIENDNNLDTTTIISKSRELATNIKSIMPQAKIFGPGTGNYASHQTLSGVFGVNFKYNYFADFYIDRMKDVIDVYDIHWYPYDPFNEGVSIERRIQFPRTLWDPTYNDSLLTLSFDHPPFILPYLKESIKNSNADLEISVSEYYCGAPHHISGGIAQADVLGIYGREDVYYASLFWPSWDNDVDTLDGYIKSAFDIFRNYDDNGASFGSKAIPAMTDDIVNSSVYASLNDQEDQLHIVVINKEDRSQTATISVSNLLSTGDVVAYYFDNNDNRLIQSDEKIEESKINLEMNPRSVYHLIVENIRTTSTEDISALESKISVSPNPVQNQLSVHNSSQRAISYIELVDVSGKVILTEVYDLQSINLETLPKGNYFVRLHIEDIVVTKKIVKN